MPVFSTHNPHTGQPALSYWLILFLFGIYLTAILSSHERQELIEKKKNFRGRTKAKEIALLNRQTRKWHWEKFLTVHPMMGFSRVITTIKGTERILSKQSELWLIIALTVLPLYYSLFLKKKKGTQCLKGLPRNHDRIQYALAMYVLSLLNSFTGEQSYSNN